jgi:hypothetical protein
MGGIYEYPVEMGSGAMIYILNFIKIGSGNQNLIVGGFIDTQHGDHISLFYFSKIREVSYK